MVCSICDLIVCAKVVVDSLCFFYLFETFEKSPNHSVGGNCGKRATVRNTKAQGSSGKLEKIVKFSIGT